MRKKLFSISAVATALATPLLALAAASPTIPDPGAGDVAASIDDFYILFCVASNWIFGFVLLGAVIVLLFGAVAFFTARGNEDQVASARRYVTYALVGVAIAVLSRALIYVVGSFVGAEPEGFINC